jgi:hypothetical protein
MYPRYLTTYCTAGSQQDWARTRRRLGAEATALRSWHGSVAGKDLPDYLSQFIGRRSRQSVGSPANEIIGTHQQRSVRR